jgi:DNA-binding CsgD family transcriptional regulator
VLLAEGRSRSDMAVTLHIAEGTVDTHVKNIYRKLGVKRRAEVRGIVLPPQ